MTKRSLKIMPEYECFPLWEELADGSVNIDPEVLPIPVGLKRRLRDWTNSYESTYNRADPSASGFPTQSAEDHFDAEGIAIWVLMRNALIKEADVSYYSVVKNSFL